MTSPAPTAQKRVLDLLRADIVRGVLRPGEKLNEDALARRYQVSRTPLRAAIRRLAAEGLVETVPHRGARIAPMTAADVRDYFEVRKILDGHAIRMACQHISESELRRLHAVMRDMEATHHAGHFPENFERLLEYHATMLRHMRNRHLEHAAKRIARKFSLLRFLLAHTTGMERMMKGLKDILNCVEARDPDAAQQAAESALDLHMDIVFEEIITAHPYLKLHSPTG